MHMLLDEMASRLLPPQRQSPLQPFTSVSPLLHGAPSPVMPQQARWPAPPHGLATRASQWPLELMRVGLAEQTQLPVQPGTSTRYSAQERPLISSPPQQARWPTAPHGVAWMHQELAEMPW